jgi:hypothetical protein
MHQQVLSPSFNGRNALPHQLLDVARYWPAQLTLVDFNRLDPHAYNVRLDAKAAYFNFR